MSEILGQFREEELPPSHVDIQAAVRSGRRRRRTRTSFATAGAVALLAVGALTVPPRVGQLAGPQPAGRPHCGGPIPADYTNLLAYHLDASAVAGFTVTAHDNSAGSDGHFDGLSPAGEYATLVNPARDRTIEVAVFPAGLQPYFPWHVLPAQPIDPSAGEPAPPVDGHAAFWLPQELSVGEAETLRYGQGLAWQWAPGAWALLTAGDPVDSPPNQQPVDDDATLRQLAQQVAPQLVFRNAIPVAAPFSMPVPDCTRLLVAGRGAGTASDGAPFATFSLMFGNDAGGFITITADSAEQPADRPGSPTATGGTGPSPDPSPTAEWSTVDGHLAWEPHEIGALPGAEGSTGIIIYDVDGFAVSIDEGDTGWDKTEVFRTIRMYQGVTIDPATWGPPIS